MGNEVYANGREVSCKAAAGKSICAMPDVCMTPPQTPATPPGVPIPYPNTGMASDMTDGSKNVKISGKEVILKDKSYFKKSMGDEAGCAPMKGVITHKIQGKVYFKSWSMDVKFEGENVVRHLDMTTHNHASETGQTPPWPYADSMKVGTGDPCETEKANEEKACEDYKPNDPNGKDVCKEAGVGSEFSRGKGVATKRTKSASQDPCMAARKCKLLPYDAEPRDGYNGCCPAQTGDHIIPKSSFFQTSFDAGDHMPGWEGYKYKEAPCICLEGGSCSGSHGLRHAYHKAFSSVPNGTERAFNDELKHCAESAVAVAPGCNQACIEAQLKEGHKGMGDQRKKIKHSSTGKNFIKKTAELLKKIKEMIPMVGSPPP